MRDFDFVYKYTEYTIFYYYAIAIFVQKYVYAEHIRKRI